MSTKVKICGVTNVTDARVAVDAGAAAVGLNFYSRSPRCLSADAAREISDAVSSEVCVVGVFVNEVREAVEAMAENARLSALQFHGDESAEYCRGWQQTTVKAIRIRNEASVAQIAEFDTDFVLVDAYAQEAYGGSGETFAWALLGGVDRSRLILAGGLHPGNVADAVRQVRPYAVDVASGVEIQPGLKDPDKVRRFVSYASTA